jgi:hypothetical protein
MVNADLPDGAAQLAARTFVMAICFYSTFVRRRVLARSTSLKSWHVGRRSMSKHDEARRAFLVGVEAGAGAAVGVGIGFFCP